MGLRRLFLVVPAVLAALPAQSAMAQTPNQPPVACFSQSPAMPAPGQAVTFNAACSSDPEGRLASRAWDLDNDGAFDDSTSNIASRSFPTSGTYTVRLSVTDNRGAVDVETKTVTVNRRPTACFTHTPAAPKTGETVTFDSACSTDPDGTVVAASWDLNGDGAYRDVDGRTATRSFAAPGTYTVRLIIADDKWAFAEVERTITVENRPPSAAFTYSPAEPVAGDTVTLTSAAGDPDGTIAAQAWDLDDDGQYDDATGPSASFTPTAAGSRVVSLRVADDNGAASTARQTITVGSRPAAPRPTPPPGTGFDSSTPVVPPQPPSPPAPIAPLRLLDPFPVVRMRGRTTRRGARLTMFSVRGPDGATVQIRCKGRGCPAKRLRRTIRTKSGRGARTVRFARLERFLPGGVVLQVRVGRPGMVGKYTRIRIRRLKLPVRVDRCVLPGSARPAACPEAP